MDGSVIHYLFHFSCDLVNTKGGILGCLLFCVYALKGRQDAAPPKSPLTFSAVPPKWVAADSLPIFMGLIHFPR